MIEEEKRKRQPNVRMKDIPLLPPDKISLKRAIDTLLDPENIETAHQSINVSNFAFVGPLDVNLRMNEICHASASYHAHKSNNDLQYRSKYSDRTYDYLGVEYYHPKTREWVLGVKPKLGRRVYNYRYMITWSCNGLKEEYNGEYEDFSDDEKDAVRFWYNYLRNESHFSRFFVGPNDIDTLFDAGCICDMSAPSAIIHMAQVLWRMPGEYVKMPVEFKKLCDNGINPHLALGMCQNMQGFGDVRVKAYRSPGHMAIYSTDFETLARLAEGVIYLPTKEQRKQARHKYSCSSNAAYNGVELGHEDCGADASWLVAVGKELNADEAEEGKEEKAIWGAKRPLRKGTNVKSELFAKPWSKGMLKVYAGVQDALEQKGLLNV